MISFVLMGLGTDLLILDSWLIDLFKQLQSIVAKVVRVRPGSLVVEECF